MNRFGWRHQFHHLSIELKTVTLTLAENHLGRFVRISEEVRGRRDAIVIPTTGLQDLTTALLKLTRLAS